jgi:hypothetical protein
MSTTGGDLSSDQGTMEVESGLLTAMLGVKVRRLVLLVVHPDDDSEESRNDGHDGDAALTARARRSQDG